MQALSKFSGMISNCLMCLPDLTGFTKFISDADINFSGKVIPTILKSIINGNRSEFKVGEVEGDAILFYTFEPFPSLQQLYDQSLHFFTTFQEGLKEIEKEYPDEYRKYLSAGKLGLKVVLHSGLTTDEKIETRTKLIGEDVIIAHRLLKNSVSENEYILLSESLLSTYEEEDISKTFNGIRLRKGRDYYEHIGMIPYRYFPVNGII